MNKNYYKNEKGQALLFVIVVLTVAMAVGLSVANRTISSVRRSTNTDTSSRVFSAAEGGIEWFLKQPQNVLTNLSDGNNNGGTECPEGTSDLASDDYSCVINYAGVSGDNINTRATVSISPFTFNNPAGSVDHYWFYLNSGEVKEIRLNGTYTGTLRVCWNSQDTSSPTPDLYFNYYTYATGTVRKGYILNRNASNTARESSLVTVASAASPYSNLDFTECGSVTITESSVQGLRIKSLYAPAKVGVFVLSGTLPTQGFIINSKGELIQNEAIKTVKKLKVYRSYQYIPSVFDYAVYSNETLGITPMP